MFFSQSTFSGPNDSVHSELSNYPPALISCPEEYTVGQTQREDDSCESTLANYMNKLPTAIVLYVFRLSWCGF